MSGLRRPKPADGPITVTVHEWQPPHIAVKIHIQELGAAIYYPRWYYEKALEAAVKDLRSQFRKAFAALNKRPGLRRQWRKDVRKAYG